ncbi:competence protein CoiA family protein [[Kitasatospora] papulosa]|uniref:competence protein CoiA family protein n=1 Tax=[Kitasatospora] papulosa TaxID=1464011 RepID=UPI00369F4AE2
MSPFANEEDTRKVQTAVIGRAGSDTPAFLPYDHGEFDLFMRGRSRSGFYCGILLGGCGKPLTPKRYVDKKCHFAHHAPVHCRRTANDESSADHLYIGQAVTEWLQTQKQSVGQPDYRPGGHQVRDVVDVPYESGRHLVRVQLSRRSKREWEEADAGLHARHESLDWLFGPDSFVANWQMERQGYALRIQCRSIGAAREVEIGTQFPDRPVDWCSLADCTLAPQGVVTPSLVQTANGIIPRHALVIADANPSSLPLLPPDSVIVTDTTSTHSTETHRYFEVTVRVAGRIALPVDSKAPEPRRSYLPVGATLSLDSDGTWLISAEGLQPVQVEAAPQRTESSLANDRHPPRPQPEQMPSDSAVVRSFRKTLESTARSRGIVTISTLCKRAMIKSDALTPERWRTLLIQVEQPRTPGKPILSALVKDHDGGPAPFFAEVLRGLGWTKSFSRTELLDVWSQEGRRVHAAFGNSQLSTASAASPNPRLESFPQTSRTTRAASAAVRHRAACDALIDWAYEAQRADDLDSVEQVLLLLDGVACPPETDKAAKTLTEWFLDRSAGELYEAWEFLSTLTEHLNQAGDDLHPDQLRRLLDRAEEVAREVGEELGAAEIQDIDRWRQHLAQLAARPSLSEIRRHAMAVRVALRRNAGEMRTTTWGELATRIDLSLSSLHPEDRVAVLVEVDRDTPDASPPLSALVTDRGGDRPHPLYRQILFNLDRLTPAPEALYMHWRMALRHHFGWGWEASTVKR